MTEPSALSQATPETPSAMRGSLAHHVAHDFFSNSAHFPLANLLLELLIEGPSALGKPDVLALLLVGMVQSWFLGLWEQQGKNRRLLGNLIGPTIYTVLELALEGAEFFEAYNHLAYWVFSLVIGIASTLEFRLRGRGGEPFVLIESMARTYIMLGMYWIFEISLKPEHASPIHFFEDGSHVFFALAVTILGAIIGLERITSRRRSARIHDLTQRLGEYSEWLLGRELLARALEDPDDALRLQRRDRFVLFIDIRGFTAWSEDNPPETVVAMLNRYFSLSEDAWQRHGAIKAKYTGDEVMAVFADGPRATGAATDFVRTLGPALAEYGLKVGVGIHCGPLMEGALGSERIKAYDVIGDTVNTAKRLCDNAAPGEILVSADALARLGTPDHGAPRSIVAKGKRLPIEVYPLSFS